MFDVITNLFKKPTAVELAAIALQDSQRQLIQYEANAAYNNKLAEYYRDNIKRMTKYSVEVV